MPGVPFTQGAVWAGESLAMNNQQLVVFWSKREQDFLIRYPSSPDGHLACSIFTSERQRYDYEQREVVFDKSFVAELESRGYDTTTLRFSVKRRPREKASS